MITYGFLAILALLFARHLHHCWQSTAPTTPETESAIAPPPVAPPPPVEDLADLLSIPASQPQIEVIESALVPLAKLFSVPGAGKWGNARKLRQSERERVLQAIAA